MAWIPQHSAELCVGRVMHKRLRPVVHPFSYSVFFLRITVSRFNEIGNRWLSRDRFNLLSVMTRDYGPRDGSNLDAWARALLARAGITQADGTIVLQAFPRVLGYVFNPISIWYCFDQAGLLRAAICEVNNTFGERHNYLVAHSDERPIEPGDWLAAKKVFYVSPFCEVKGHYRFRFEQTGERAFAQIDYYDAADVDEDAYEGAYEGGGEPGKLIATTVHGKPQALTAASALSAFITHPLMTFGVVARIHWQALKLWVKRVKFISKPKPPVIETTR